MPRLRTLFSLALMAAGGAAALNTLAARQPARARDRTAGIVVDYDDVQAVSIRAGIPPAALLPGLRASGATHCSLPERTLNRLLATGQIFQRVPSEPPGAPPPFGQWIYLSSASAALLADLAAELAARLPQLQARVLPADPHTLTLAGDLPAVGGIGLGFDALHAAVIHNAGLAVVPRPVSYDWHEPPMIERTIAQAADVGDGVVAFEGSLILGHEMHLDTTLEALASRGLTFAYFAESRHQRGDWFIAKRRMPHVVVAHQFTPSQMIPEDYHSIAHHWANLARERGVRLLFINFFRVVHATGPLECLKYLEHVRDALEGDGFIVAAKKFEAKSDRGSGSAPCPAPADSTGQLVGLVPAGAAAAAGSALLGLPAAPAIALGVAGAAAAVAGAGRLDQARNALEQQYAPAYSSKLLALSTATLAPLAAAAIAQASDAPLEALLADGVVSASAAAALAALTSSEEYRLRVEEYKGFDLELWLPLAGVIILQPGRLSPKLAGLGAVLGGWYATRRVAPDWPARFDAAPAMSHSHHLSSAMRMLGDVLLAIGPRPIRKWAGLAPLGLALNIAARRRGHGSLAFAAMALSIAGHAAANTGFRRPERDPSLTAWAAAKSWLAGAALGLIIAKLPGDGRFAIDADTAPPP